MTPPRPQDLPSGRWTDAALRVLRERYLAKDETGTAVERPEDRLWAVAWTVAQAERAWGAHDAQVLDWARRFYRRMARHELLPNSPALANAGKGHGLQYSACFVLPVADQLTGPSSIFGSLTDAAQIFQSGGGCGYSFSRLRPRGWRVRSTGGTSSGPVSFLRIYDAATEHVKQGGMRRGANMGILRVDHPDILAFIDAKREGGLRNFNLSVGITDRFMDALKRGARYELVAQPGWPLPNGATARGDEVVGSADAREVWRRLCERAWASGDPGLFFVDRANQSPANALPGRQTIEATNPCGEQPLPPYGICNLAHINLGAFAAQGAIDWAALDEAVGDGIRFLDDMLEVNPYPLPQIRAQALGERRIGLGVMGWADLLLRLGLPYASEAAVELAAQLGRRLLDTARAQSRALAAARGPFPWFAESIYAGEPPRRHANLTTVAPTGTVSLLADCSSGIEPLFALAFQHRVRQPDGDERVLDVVNPVALEVLRARGLDRPAVRDALRRHGSVREAPGVPDDVRALLATAHEIAVDWHVRHQAAWQQAFSESAVSKTINLPQTATVDDVASAYQLAWDLGCLGITVFRDGSTDEQVLHAGTAAPAAPAPSPLVEPRPRVVLGRTWKVPSPHGSVYVTLNTTASGEPFEVFVRVGKAGSDIEAYAEALGRLMSLILRYNRLPDRRTRIARLVEQLVNIGGAREIGFGPSRVRSVPDAIAKALAESLEPDGAGADPPSTADTPSAVGDLCPMCQNATFVVEEGCRKCHACGHSEC
jgi:ribonucleoside-diphosphate reductase alpha chain